MIKQFCSKIVFQTVSVFNFARFNLIIIRSIELKSITKTKDLHFLSRLTHFQHFLNNKKKRHCFCSTAQRTQTINIIIQKIKLMRSAQPLLNFVLLNNIMNFRNKNFKEEKWYYDSIILNKKSWQRHVITVDQEVFLDKRLLIVINNHDRSIDCVIIESYFNYQRI